MGSANDYYVTPSLIGRAHTVAQNDVQNNTRVSILVDKTSAQLHLIEIKLRSKIKNSTAVVWLLAARMPFQLYVLLVLSSPWVSTQEAPLIQDLWHHKII